MKIKQKRIISLFLAMLMLFSVLPTGTMTASAAYENTYKNTGNQRTDIIGVAKTQIGNTTGSKYTFGAGNVSWCAYFIVWCARQANIDSSIIKTTGWADADDLGVKYYSRDSYTPKNGDIIIFDYPPYNTKTPASSYGDHVGLVEYIEGNNVHTIEGNSSPSPNAVRRHSYALSNSNIKGYGVPNYTSGPHSCSFSGSYFESAHPHKVYQKCSCGKTKYTGATKAYANCSTCMKLSTAYVMPVKAYTINTGKTTVYSSVNGTAKSNKIYDTDLCTISQIYNCGWCKVTFPLDAGGTDTGYCKISVFMKSGGYIAYTSKQTNTFRRSDLKTSNGYAGAGDKIYILGVSGSSVQIAYPLTAGGYKVGWVPTSAIKCTVSYNANGGTGSISNTSVQYNNAFTLSANKFTKTGYTFSGWNVYRSSDKKWYVSNKGWYTANEITSKGYTKKLYSDKWSGTLSQPWMNLGKTNDTFTFYAVWTPNALSVSYNANGGKLSSDTYKLSSNIVYNTSDSSKYVQKWTYNSTKTNGLVNASTFGLTKEGYNFKGWGTTASGGTIFDQDDTKLVPTSINSSIKNGSCSTTLYAIWEAKTYSVKFDANGGSGAPSAQTKTYGKSLTLSTAKPTRDGYNFLGWATSKTATSANYQPGASYTSNSAVTLYAVWQAVSTTPTHTHEWNPNYTLDKEATCTETGLKSIHCKICSETKNTTTIPASGHIEVIDPAVTPTCTKTGLTQGSHCSKCNKIIVKQNIVAATNHSYDKGIITKQPTCTSAGITTYTCTKCGATKTETIAKTAHTYNVVETEPTCTEKGYTTYTCKCGENYISNYTDPIGHTYKTTIKKATLEKNGSITTKCAECGDIEMTTIYSPKTIKLSATSYTYDGKVKKPNATVKDSKGKTISSSNYTVTYASGRKSVGKYAVKITFKGNYSGSKTLYFTINPKATSIAGITAKSKGFTVKWKKQATQTTGYQIQYSTSSKFSNAKTVTVGKNSTTSKTISKLTGKKKYYVRVRTYKTVNEKKYYSAWSKAKTITTKK